MKGTSHTAVKKHGAPRAVARAGSARQRDVKVRRILSVAILGDATVIILGLLLGFWIRFGSGWLSWLHQDARESRRELGDYLGLLVLGCAYFLLSLAYTRLYQVRYILRPNRFTAHMLRTACFWLAIYLGTSLFLKFDPPISRAYAIISFVTASVGLVGWRFLFAGAASASGTAEALRQRLTVVGSSPDAARIIRAVQGDRRQPYALTHPLTEGEFNPYNPSCDELHRLISAGETDIILLADLDRRREDILDIANACERGNVEFKLVPDYFQVLISGLHLETISGMPILGVTALPLDRFLNRMIKRLIDIVGALVGLAISAPVMFLCAILVKKESPGPVFFGQERVGRSGTRFKMFKIRSMKPDAGQSDHLNQSTLREDPRVLRIGKVMRKWNLDEVPQFWNVLVGDMSLVGPRPERSYHVEVLSSQIPHYNARHAAKPGITGWAQVNGLRGDTDLGERVRCDLWYLENWSVWLDFQIMAMTFLSRKNAY